MMEFKKKNTTMRGIVKRRRGDRYGIMFPDCQMDGDLDPPGAFLVIFKALERMWLAKKLD